MLCLHFRGAAFRMTGGWFYFSFWKKDRKGQRMTQRGKPSSSRGRSAGMNKTTGMVLVVIVVVIGVLVVVWMNRPRRTEALGTISCSDGPRLLVDAGKFD